MSNPEQGEFYTGSASEALIDDEDRIAVIDEFLDWVTEDGQYGDAKAAELSKDVTGLLLNQLRIPQGIGEVEMINPKVPVGAVGWKVTAPDGRPLKVNDYMGSGLAARHQVEASLLDIVEKGAEHPDVRVYVEDAWNAIVGHLDPTDQRTIDFFDELKAAEAS